MALSIPEGWREAPAVGSSIWLSESVVLLPCKVRQSGSGGAQRRSV